MNTVFEKTRELGEALMASEEYKAMKAAEDAAMADAEAAGLLDRYLEAKTKLEELLKNSDPDRDEIQALGESMQDLQSQFQSVPVIIEMTRTRDEFDGLIDQVNQVLHFIITGEMEENGGCGGACETCPGCH
ncbi:MAG: YlbF family regulator [Clostridia bacterium]|nr:YlbF family regulator [Clostridia bacterium]